MIRNLKDELFEVVNNPPDTRFQAWAKTVVSVDPNGTDGYAFEGEFVRDGTVEIESKPALFLVMTTGGSRKYQTRCYQIVEMLPDGTLAPTDIQTSDKQAGWALRIRDQVIDKLASLESHEPAWTAEDAMRELVHLLSAIAKSDVTRYLLIPPEMREIIESFADQEVIHEL